MTKRRLTLALLINLALTIGALALSAEKARADSNRACSVNQSCVNGSFCVQDFGSSCCPIGPSGCN